jgi:tRNA modification GTPase
MVDLNDTICALSSAPGRSGIAVVRVSGPQCLEIISRIFKPRSPYRELPERRALLGSIGDPRTGAEVDEAIVTCFHSPHSYTGENVAEASVHGSPVIVSQLLEVLCREGARLAEPGEFTLRAFLHGRMDLAQAEGVRDVIEANTRYQLQVASRQRAGELSEQLQPIRRQWTDVIVSLEAAVEFVEEDLAIESRALLAAKLDGTAEELAKWIGTFRRGRIVRDGFSLAIAGRPNAGKSSLFNALLAEERSIVTEIPGTTRDAVSEFASIGGIPVRLIDTAGLREGEDRIERIGVDRSLRVMADADAIVLVIDTSRPCTEEDDLLRARLGEFSCVVAFNKSDLPDVWTASQKARYGADWPCVEVSALTGSGIDRLRHAIQTHLFGEGTGERDGLLVTNLRHCQCLEEAHQALSRAAVALRDGLSEEFVLADLHAGLKKLGEITGETSVEEVLGEIFSRFCIGK